MRFVCDLRKRFVVLSILCRVFFVIVQTVDLIKRNSSKFTNNSILKAKQMVFASNTHIHWNSESYDEYFRLAFDTFDANDDGSIDFDEFLLAISATSHGDLDDRLSVAFDM